jgi:hypothetical protein
MPNQILQAIQSFMSELFPEVVSDGSVYVLTVCWSTGREELGSHDVRQPTAEPLLAKRADSTIHLLTLGAVRMQGAVMRIHSR